MAGEAAAARLLDWQAAARFGGRLAGSGPPVAGTVRAHIREEFAELVPQAEGLVTEFTGMRINGPRTRPWVMSRGEWIAQNLRGFERVLGPVAERIVGRRADGMLAPVRRKVLAAQVGGLLGYLGRKVLGQYDLFVEPEDRDLLYFVGPNVVELERRFGFSPRDFRLWLCLHEVAHRVQFSGVPWLRDYLQEQVREYLDSVDLDARRLIETIRRAAEEARRGGGRVHGFLFLLMTPGQRETFRRMQAVMSLLEGHGNYVMDSLAPGLVRDADRMRRTLHRRRHGRPMERMVQRGLGIDSKIRQYDLGERFVARAVERAGMDGFNRVWGSPEVLPALEEIQRPDAWVERVASA